MRKNNLQKLLQGLTDEAKEKKLQDIAMKEELAYWRSEGLRAWKDRRWGTFSQALRSKIVRETHLAVETVWYPK